MNNKQIEFSAKKIKQIVRESDKLLQEVGDLLEGKDNTAISIILLKLSMFLEKERPEQWLLAKNIILLLQTNTPDNLLKKIRQQASKPNKKFIKKAVRNSKKSVRKK